MSEILTDRLGNPMTPEECELLELYTRVARLGGRGDLPPVVTANCKQAEVALWNACNDLVLLPLPVETDPSKPSTPH